MPKKIRRAVTGHNEEGKSVIISDDPSPHVLAVPGLALTDLWVTDGSPADNAGRADAADRPVVLEPPPGGTIFRIVEFPSEKSLGEHFDHKATFDAMSGSGAMDPDHPGMHKTLTVDYVIVLSGEIYVVMDEGETLLRAGDTLVQRGTNHAWSNRSETLCLMACILVSASPGATHEAIKFLS